MRDDVGEALEPVAVHPLADIFPMMSDEELDGLATDIRNNGLIHPIVVDTDGYLVDGRNRKAACDAAAVIPRYTLIDAKDAPAFIASANLNRRHMTKGQQAIALAIIYPEPEKGGRGNIGGVKEAKKLGGFSDERLRQARSVLSHSRALAEDVLADRTKLDAALAIVKQEREASASVDARMAELRQHAPDLADMVDDERLPLAEATAALKQRQEDAEKAERNKRITYLRLCEAASSITALANEGFIEGLSARLEADEEFRTEWQARVRFAAEHPDELKPGVNAFAKLLKHYGGP